MTSEDNGNSAHELVGRLARIPEIRQRAYALALRLRDRENESILDAIKSIRERALKGEEDFLRLYNSLLAPSVLAEVLGKERISDLADMARARDELELVAILLDAPADRGPAGAYLQPYLDSGLKEVPLGMRKSLARKPDFKMIARIARDQDHRVIEHLLDNPRLTERDVIRIAAVRPNSPKVIEVIYKHPRWIIRYSVKKTIVLNPHSPLPIALRLLALLNPADLEEVCGSSDLHPELLKEARTILEKKNLSAEQEWTLFE